MTCDKSFGNRITELRLKNNVSARDMSLSLGQSESYINKIENSKSFPSMDMFFYICEYFKISPEEFFNYGNKNPVLLREVMEDLSKVDEKYINNIHQIIKGLQNKVK